MEFLDKHKILTTSQHGFRSGHSCETQLIQTIHDFTSALDNKTQTDVIITDLSKAFDTVPHNRLFLKCSHYKIDGRINDWLSAFIKDSKQRVVIGGDFSDCADVVSLAHCYFSSILTICLTTSTQQYIYLSMTVCCI